jgi:hypothetical protein
MFSVAAMSSISLRIVVNDLQIGRDGLQPPSGRNRW